LHSVLQRSWNSPKTREILGNGCVQFVDLRFMDFPGLWQHTTCPISELTLGKLRSRLRLRRQQHPRLAGDQRIGHAAGPRRHTAKIDPFMLHTTLVDHLRRARSDHQEGIFARSALHRPQGRSAYLKKTKIADTPYFGPELEFFIFDQAFYDQGINFRQALRRQPRRHLGPRRRGPDNLGYKIRLKEGYFPTPPMDTMQNIRSEMVATLIELGIPVEAHHHEVATGGQCEIDMRYQDLVTMADNVMMYKYVCKNVAARHGKVVTFMPKPLFQDNGSGMHVHFSLWKGDKPLFAGNKYAGLSEMGLYAIGGILKHAGPCAPCAIRPPTATSGWCPATKRR
jgi:glutamine synthetase